MNTKFFVWIFVLITILGSVTSITFDDFSIFNTDLLPSNSDVVFILSQYIGCMEKLRSENIENYGDWYWVINGKQSEIRTAPPKKISYNK